MNAEPLFLSSLAAACAEPSAAIKESGRARPKASLSGSEVPRAKALAQHQRHGNGTAMALRCSPTALSTWQRKSHLSEAAQEQDQVKAEEILGFNACMTGCKTLTRGPSRHDCS